jgi:sulfur carrier protein ThiS adenylyltransferase
MNDFERAIVEQFGQEHLDKVQSVKVGIAGAGGLGSNCAFNLVRAGFKNFKIVDFDKVEYSNLNRQFYFVDQVGMLKVRALEQNLKRINPGLEVEALAERITEKNVRKVFSDSDVIVEAFDRAGDKRMIVEAFLGSGRFLVSGSGIAGLGDSDGIRVNRLKRDLVLIGDLTSDIEHSPPVSPRVNVAAAKQADVILEFAAAGPEAGC